VRKKSVYLVVANYFADIPIASGQAAPIRFTFFWPAVDRWEGRDFVINVEGTP
jgi:hypothetical protein